jgi:hypothetical protein
MAQGKALEECLASYPKEADNLRPLLMASQETLSLSSTEPDPKFKQAARARFDRVLSERVRSKPRRQWLPALHWKLKGWATAAAALLVFFSVGAGTVQASSNSVPGQPLYPVKEATEQVRLAFSFSDSAKARLYAELAERRAREMADLARKGETERLPSLAEKMAEQLDKSVALHGIEPQSLTQQRVEELRRIFGTGIPSGEVTQVKPIENRSEIDRLKAEMETSFVKSRERLAAGLRDAPLEAKESVRHTLEIHESNYDRVLLALKAAQQDRDRVNGD